MAKALTFEEEAARHTEITCDPKRTLTENKTTCHIENPNRNKLAILRLDDPKRITSLRDKKKADYFVTPSDSMVVWYIELKGAHNAKDGVEQLEATLIHCAKIHATKTEKHCLIVCAQTPKATQFMQAAIKTFAPRAFLYLKDSPYTVCFD